MNLPYSLIDTVIVLSILFIVFFWALRLPRKKPGKVVKHPSAELDEHEQRIS